MKSLLVFALLSVTCSYGIYLRQVGWPKELEPPPYLPESFDCTRRFQDAVRTEAVIIFSPRCTSDLTCLGASVALNGIRRSLEAPDFPEELGIGVVTVSEANCYNRVIPVTFERDRVLAALSGIHPTRVAPTTAFPMLATIVHALTDPGMNWTRSFFIDNDTRIVIRHPIIFGERHLIPPPGSPRNPFNLDHPFRLDCSRDQPTQNILFEAIRRAGVFVDLFVASRMADDWHLYFPQTADRSRHLTYSNDFTNGFVNQLRNGSHFQYFEVCRLPRATTTTTEAPPETDPPTKSIEPPGPKPPESPPDATPPDDKTDEDKSYTTDKKTSYPVTRTSTREDFDDESDNADDAYPSSRTALFVSTGAASAAALLGVGGFFAYRWSTRSSTSSVTPTTDEEEIF